MTINAMRMCIHDLFLFVVLTVAINLGRENNRFNKNTRCEIVTYSGKGIFAADFISCGFVTIAVAWLVYASATSMRLWTEVMNTYSSKSNDVTGIAVAVMWCITATKSLFASFIVGFRHIRLIIAFASMFIVTCAFVLTEL